MSWAILIVAGALEAVWATSLSASDGLRRPGPTVLFGVAAILSMAGLAVAMTGLPTGTAYAVWVGIGATLTVVWAMVRGRERMSVVRCALLVVLVAGVVGLKAVG